MSDNRAASDAELVDGRYELGPCLGTGGMSQVFRAHDVLLGRDVAVKIFGPSVDAHGPDRERAEMRTLAALSHPRLVTVHDAGTDLPFSGPARAYLVMELIDGPSLAEVLTAGPLDPAAVRRVGAGVADALSYVHSRDIIHRDIKPANILLDQAGNPHLADFGIAQALGAAALTATGLTIGTAPYLSPEQVLGNVVGPPSDVYALGLVLLEALNGRREYPGQAVETALARLSRPPVIDADLPHPWPELLRAMTASDPALRPAASEIVHALGAAATDATTIAARAVQPGRPVNAPTRALPPLTRAVPKATALPPPVVRQRKRAPIGAWKVVTGSVLALLLLVLAVRAVTGPSGTTNPSGASPTGTPGPSRLGPDLDRLDQLVRP